MMKRAKDQPRKPIGTYLAQGICAGDLLLVSHNPCELDGEIVVAVGTIFSAPPPAGYGFGDLIIVQHERRMLEVAYAPSWLRHAGKRKSIATARAPLPTRQDDTKKLSLRNPVQRASARTRHG